jgi:hypothetical protein
MTPAELRALADWIESEDCTGIAAQWCPVHGDCTCPPERVFEHGEWVDRVLDKNHPQCPLHGAASSHAAAIAQDCQEDR